MLQVLEIKKDGLWRGSLEPDKPSPAPIHQYNFTSEESDQISIFKAQPDFVPLSRIRANSTRQPSPWSMSTSPES